MTMALFLLLVALAGRTAHLFAIRAGRPAPLRDAEGNTIPRSLSDRVNVEIGGIRQGMFIQSVDPAAQSAHGPVYGELVRARRICART